jgi:hypothetical protein
MFKSSQKILLQANMLSVLAEKQIGFMKEAVIFQKSYGAGKNIFIYSYLQ